MATYKPYRKVSSTEKEEIRIPYSVLVDTPNMSEYTKRASDETITGTWTYSNAPKMDTLENSKGNAMYHFNSSKVFFGQTTVPIALRGSLERPQYTTDGTTFQDIALKSDIVAPVADANAAKTYVYYVTGDGEHAGYDIEHPLGADVNVSVYLMGQSIFGETMDELVMVDVYTKLNKVKLVFNSAPSLGMKFKVVITGVVFAPSKVLNDNSWDAIRQVILAGEASNYWKVGDTKTITSKSGKTYTIRLADLQDGRYEYSDGSGSSKAVFEFVEGYNLNGTIRWEMLKQSTIIDETFGVWDCTLIKNVTIPEILSDLPDDMVSVMSEVNVPSGVGTDYVTTALSVNKLFLPAICELTNSTSIRINHNESPLGLLDYYSNDNSNTRIKNIVGETGGEYWWLRSPIGTGISVPDMFGFVSSDGSLAYDLGYYVHAVAPIFVI